MSSDYETICLDHDPPIVSHGDYRTAQEALAEARRPYRHPHCDLLVGRWSGGLVEVGCPGQAAHDNRPHPGWHRDTQWIQVPWLRLAVAALELPPEVRTEHRIGEMLTGALDFCWQEHRVRRLSLVLGMEDSDG